MAKKFMIVLLFYSLCISILIGGCNTIQHKAPTVTPKYPTQPITMIVPFSAGGALDMLARTLEKDALKYLGQPLVVINKPGGSGAIGWNELAGATPDGYTLGITSPEAIILPLYGSTKYHYPTALQPILQISAAPWVMIVHAEQPWQDVAAVINYAKQHPGQLKFGHSGIGSIPHIIGETFAKKSDITLDQVPFRGASESTMALLGKHIQIIFTNPANVSEHLKSGTARALAVSGGQREMDPLLAQVPTFKEQGLDIEFNSWLGVASPKDLAPEIKIKLAEGFKAIIADPEFKINMDKLGAKIEYLDAKESEEKWLTDNTKLTKIVQETGILEKIKAQKN